MLSCSSSLVGASFALLFATSSFAQLTDALSVRSLTAEQAKEAREVQLHATVGFVESPGTVFVQDATAGTFLRTKSPLGDLREGDIVDAQGATFPGLFLPGVELTSFRVVGHGEVPKAQPASYDDLASARFHYQRVRIEGIVRSVTPQDENRSVLRLAMGSRVLEVRVDGPAPMDESLVDARVQIDGLAAGTINDLRQMVQPYVRVSNWSAIATLEPAPAVDAVPVATTTRLLRFSASGDTGHRVRVEGTVTAVFGSSLIFIHDEEASVAVQLTEATPVAVSDRVVVDGFPMMDRFTPTLADARWIQKQGTQTAETAVLKLKELTKRAHDGCLISVSGTVVESYRGTEGQTVVVVGDGVRLPARISQGDAVNVERGSLVQLTGISRVETVSGKGFNARPETFSLWLRAAGDLQVLREPSAWTVERLLTVLGVLAFIVMGGLVWILMLRRQVSALQLRIRHEAALEERQRIAREFHDTLEQELAGLSLRMDAAATRPMEDKARALLETSRSLVSRIQIEARNLVADLRNDPDTQVELAAALQDLAQRQPANAPIIKLELDGTQPSLPSPVVHHLRMIAQEAVTNALKHARATAITLRLRSLEHGLELTVSDDGLGFDPNAHTQGEPGHFGCMGIRERCRKIGAEVNWISAPGQGTTLRVTLESVSD